MKKKVLILIVLVAIFTLVIPAAAQGLERVGERLNIFYSGSQTFPAGEPFHIVHGWKIDPRHRQGPPGRSEIRLEVDGVLIKEDFVEVYRTDPPFLLDKLYVYNFPAGMTGVHTFTGHWLQPCWQTSEDCTNPDKQIETHTSTVEVIFED